MSKYDTAISLDGNKWTVKFEKTGKQVTTEKLFDWSKEIGRASCRERV